MLPRAIGLAEGAVGPISVTVTPLQLTPGVVTVRKYSGPSRYCGRLRRLRPDRLTAEGSIPPPRCRHHVAHLRATVPRAFAAVVAKAEETSGVAVRFSDRRLLLFVSLLEWVLTLGATTAVLLLDLVIMARRPGEPTMRRCAVALSAYVGLAVCFGIWTWFFHGQQFALEFFAGWLTEYSLSIDNLFIFVIIMTSFNVPKVYQRQALLVGIMIALIFRGIFIALGAAAIQRFSWVFYLFGAFLVYTAMRLARGAEHDAGVENSLIRFARSHLNATDRWHGLKLYIKEGSQCLMTPMFLVILALGVADLVFALDSIPAIYGLTHQPYLVFAANVFALMGLRQLYFLLGGLLQRLVYLSQGLAIILLFIGIKLMLHALRENNVSFINGGKHINVPEVPTLLTLAVIVVTLVITAAASLYATRFGDPD
jgi:tellurite resistance protein TerC